jgi:putative peptide zinc metalloprotease protein
VIGVGVYLIWPVFYNDLNDSYRLSRGGRLRADLGGVYFNAVVIVALGGVYGLTGFEPLLLLVVVEHLAILQQFLPFVRLDGYYIVSDLAGVPNLFGRIRPILMSLIVRRNVVSAKSGLKPRAQVIVTAWVLVTVPLLLAGVAFLAWRLPQLFTIGSDALKVQARVSIAAAQSGDVVRGLLSGTQVIILAIPLIGLTTIGLRATQRGLRLATRRPNVLVAALSVVIVSLLVTAVSIAATEHHPVAVTTGHRTPSRSSSGPPPPP